MGDPRKQKNKFSKPSHPWQRARIEEEAEIKKTYGLKNKREIWKALSLIRGFKRQAKHAIARSTSQSDKEGQLLLQRLSRLNILPEGSKIEDVLNLDVHAVLNRRLQTQVYKKGLARSTKQARQFITHGHICIDDGKMTIPSYLVPVTEEAIIQFKENSALSKEEHPERVVLQKEKMKTEEKKKEMVEEELKK